MIEKEYREVEVECPHCEEGYRYYMASRFTKRMEFEDYDVKVRCDECEGTGIKLIEEEVNE